jgi:hypothetical protein
MTAGNPKSQSQNIRAQEISSHLDARDLTNQKKRNSLLMFERGGLFRITEILVVIY